MDLGLEPEAVDLAKREFVAVILAGFGNELLPLTSDNGEEPCPKALLPIANKPMIDYVLSWVEQSGIKNALLICPAIHRPAIYHHIHSETSLSAPNLQVDIQTFDESQDSNTGTCNLLRHFANRISEDFVLLSCDFMPPPSLPLSTLLNKFRVETMSVGSLATACWFTGHRPEKGSFPEEWGPSARTVPIIWDESTGTLLHIDTLDDQDKNSEEIELRMSLLSRYPRVKLSTAFEDSHVYVCKRVVLELLQEKKHMDSFREEFFPWLLKIQYQPTRKKKYGEVLLPPGKAPLQELALNHSSTLSKFDGRESTKDEQGSQGPEEDEEEHSQDNHLEYGFTTFRVGVMIHKVASGFAIRVNTIPNYLEINRRILSQTTYVLSSDPKNRSLIDHKAQISTDTIVGESTSIAERSTIKKSIIGRHCIIGKMTKIVGCVLMDHCVIADGAKLDGCILGINTKIGAKAELQRCVTQAGYEVDAGETLKGEKLDVSDWTAPPDDEETEEDDEDEEEEEAASDEADDESEEE